MKRQNTGRKIVASKDALKSTVYRRVRKILNNIENNTELFNLAGKLANKNVSVDNVPENQKVNDKYNQLRHTNEIALTFFLEYDNSKSQYKGLSSDSLSRNCSIYPNYSFIKKAQKECEPNGYNDSEKEVSVSLQQMLNITAERLCNSVTLNWHDNYLNNLEMNVTLGFDSSSGYTYPNQKYEDQNNKNKDAQESLFVTSFIIIQLKSCDTDKCFCINPSPQSTRFCRPLRISLAKETGDAIRKEFDRLNNEIKRLVKHRFVMENKIKETERRSDALFFCLKTAHNFGNLSDLFATKESSLHFGLGLLHAEIKVSEHLLDMSYGLVIETWDVRNHVKHTYLAEEETKKLIELSLKGLEKCVLQFPEHYKSIYRLAYFYFHNKSFKNIVECKQLLLGTYECQFYPNQKIPGLFAERKNTNFFNGIWRIPIHEIDRPGSFASHMSRCILLLMQVLKETDDSRMLIELCIQLRKTPDTDKKYLRDAEREQLSGQALAMCLQCLRNRIKSIDEQNCSIKSHHSSIDDRIQILLDVFYAYQNIKSIQEYEVSELPKVQKLLEDAYATYVGNPNLQGNMFELAKECCRQKIRSNKTNVASFDSNVVARTTGTNTISPATNVDLSVPLNMAVNTQIRKSQKLTISGRPRGRPPGVNKFSSVTNSDSMLAYNPHNLKHTSSTTSCLSNSNNTSGPYALSSFLEQNMLAAMLGPGLNPNVIDSAMNYLNQVGAYQDVFRQYQSNLNTFSDLNVNYNKMNPYNITSNQLATKITSTRNSSSLKERPDLSITPVAGNVSYMKRKTNTLEPANRMENDQVTPLQIPTSVQNTSTAQFSLLKPPVQHILQPIADKSPNIIPFTENSVNVTSGSLFQVNQPSVVAVNEPTLCSSRLGTSLQHKLLSNKQNQRSHQPVTPSNLGKKQKPNKTLLPNNYTTLLNTENPFISSNLSTVSVTAIPSASTKSVKSPSALHKTVKSRISKPNLLLNAGQNAKSSNALSVLSQLRQHSHLEIIPQINNVKLNTDSSNVSKKSVNIPNLPEPVNFLNKDSISVYELPRRKGNIHFPSVPNIKQRDSCDKDHVEIITLDD